MIRKTLLVTGLVLAGTALWVGFAGSSQVVQETLKVEVAKVGADKEAPYVHAVIFHLKKDAPEGEVQALITDAHELLRPIPTVRGLRVGRPAEKSSPNFAKKDYQVGLLVLFDDFEGLKTYLDHPRHLKYVEKHGKYLDTDKLLVYDFVDQKK
jgi:hypothetical protein